MIMLLGILVIMVLLGMFVGLLWIVVLLLGVVLVFIDLVLVVDVQVGFLKGGEEDEVCFGLIVEVGLNDGVVFFFVNLVIVLVVVGMGELWVVKWLGYYVLWEIGVGVVGGYLIGCVFGWLMFCILVEIKLV